MGRASRTIYIDMATILDMEKLSDKYNVSINYMFEAAAIALVHQQKEGSWPEFETTFDQIKNNRRR